MQSGLRFVVEKVFTIPGRGVVVSGRVESGTISVGEELGFLGTEGQWVRAMVVAIEVSRRLVEQAEAGQAASLLLEGVRKDQITLGTILTEVPTVPAQPVSQAPLPERPTSVSIPSVSYPKSAKAIHPSSGLGRTLLFLLIGIIIILILLLLQGKWDPKEWDPRKIKFTSQESTVHLPIFKIISEI